MTLTSSTDAAHLFTGRRSALLVGVPLAALVLTSVATRPHVEPTHQRLTASAQPGSSPAAAPATSAATATAPSAAPVALTNAGDLPPEALAAYQRAATVIDAATPTCHLPWQVLAGLGGVETDHGRRTTVTDEARTTALAPDTDGGQLDGDPGRDLPVGPMGMLPSTWRVVGVDANGDGVRDPKSLDDATLAVAVYLCGQAGDLSTLDGQHTALRSYDATPGFAQSVLELANRYLTTVEAMTPPPLDLTTLPDLPVVTTTVEEPVVKKPRPKTGFAAVAAPVVVPPVVTTSAAPVVPPVTCTEPTDPTTTTNADADGTDPVLPDCEPATPPVSAGAAPVDAEPATPTSPQPELG